MIIEIEDKKGNTICGFKLSVKKAVIKKFLNCEIADIDKDYLFNTKDNLIRLQVTE